MKRLHIAQAKLLNLALTGELSLLNFREMAERVGLNSRQSVLHHLQQLEKRGLVDLSSRSASKNISGSTLFSIRILGLADCGNPKQVAEENLRGYIRVSTRFSLGKSRNLFAVQAVGDSMNDAKFRKSVTDEQTKTIENGDYLLLDSSKTSPNQGDYVLSVIDGAANIKKFYRDGERILLLSESTHNIPPIVIHPDDFKNYMVSGKVIDVIKKPNFNNQINDSEGR